jgi:hypothetical protein
MNVLLPYLIGAASTFVVQFLIQFYIVPRVQTRKHREERWVKDVLDLGELLTTSVEKLATESWEAQQEVRLLEDYSSVSEPDKAKVERQRFLRERKMAANRATRARARGCLTVAVLGLLGWPPFWRRGSDARVGARGRCRWSNGDCTRDRAVPGGASVTEVAAGLGTSRQTVQCRSRQRALQSRKTILSWDGGGPGPEPSWSTARPSTAPGRATPAWPAPRPRGSSGTT